MATEIKVRYAETDQMGVVYHSNYLVWFEVARTEYMISKGVNYRVMEEDGVYLPVIEANCRYKRPAKYMDILDIKTKLSLEGRRLTFNYEIFKEDTKITEGYTIHTFINIEGRAINLDRVYPELYQKIKDISEKDNLEDNEKSE